MNDNIKGVNELFAIMQITFIGLSLAEIQCFVVMSCSAATFAVYFIVNFEKIAEFFKKKNK